MGNYHAFLLKSACFLLPLAFAGCSGDVSDDGVFVIRNAEFGIRADKTNARATTDGINRAIEKARGEGYETVRFMPGDYLIACVSPTAYYPADGIFLYSNMTFDLGEARFHVEPNDSWSYGVFQLERLENVTVTGGEIVGDKDEHTYPEDPAERARHQNGDAFGVISCENILIRGVKMRALTGSGVRVYPYSYMLMYGMYPTDNIRITGCEFDDIGITAIYLKHAVNVEVDHNRITGLSNRAGHAGAWKVCGIRTERYDDDLLLQHVKIHDNHLRDVSGGIVIGYTADVELYDNLVEECQMGLGLYDCRRVRAYRNTVAEPGYADVTHNIRDEYNEDICLPLEGPNKNSVKLLRPYTARESGTFSCE